MKNQPTKIITCLVAGFILSACVGVINVPSSVAEALDKKTEQDPVVEKDTTVIIDDKEPEPIAIEPANPCIANPFGDTCGSAEFNDAREAICLTERESHRCLAIISAVCEADSLDALCDGKKAYFTAQYATCENEPNSERCEPTIVRVCGADSLDALCDGLAKYFTAQKTACEGEPNSERCKVTIKRVCGGDSLDVICTDYHSMQDALCTNGFVPLTSIRCAPTIKRVCGADALHYICTGKSTYYPVQKTACDSDNPRPTMPTYNGAALR